MLGEVRIEKTYSTTSPQIPADHPLTPETEIYKHFVANKKCALGSAGSLGRQVYSSDELDSRHWLWLQPRSR